MICLTNLDLSKNELQNAVIQPLAAAPANPKLGQIYTDSSTDPKRIKWYDGTGWKLVGVVYEKSSVVGKVLTGLSSSGEVTTTDVKDLQLSGYTPITGGYVAADDSLEKAIQALDTAVKNAVAGGGEVNQFAFSNIKVSTVTVSATGKTDTVELVAGNYITLTADSTAKTISIAVNIPDASAESKGLMTPSQVTKLTGIESGAQKNVKPDWNASSGSASEILNKPTKLSEFTNDEEFIDNTVNNLVNYYTKTEVFTKGEVNNLIGGIATISIQVVDNLPSSGASNIIYLKAKSTADGDTNIYDEYLWTGTKFERIGDTTVDLSNYLTKTGDASSVTVAFTTADSRSLPSSSEALNIIVGKIVKYLTDLKDVAFTGSYTDLLNVPSQIVRCTTGTLSAGSTTTTVYYTGTFVGAYILDSATKEMILADVDVSTNSATISVAQAHTNDLSISILYS